IDYNFLKYHGVDVEFGSVKLIGFPIIKKARNSKIAIGKGVTLVSHSKGNPAGINHPVILATLSEGAIITIGNGCGFSGSTICSACSIDIGDLSGFGANAAAYDTDFHSIKDFGTPSDGISRAASKPIKIGKRVWIGANTLILKGVQIEDNCIVGAGAVVRTNMSAGTIYRGNIP
ncbi:MAG: acyltransferase, partial [Candidatus Woesebacteria bacterium]|nr:acyltransferase [Candidatus Woesebacteria bacterium]